LRQVGQAGTTVPASANGPAPQPIPVGLVLLTRYRAGASWRPRRLSAGQTAIALLGHAIGARVRPGAALAIIPRAVATARGLRGVRGEASELARAILSLADVPARA
jgi:hypothetical protein